MMKILQVIPTLGQGGAEHFTVELTNELINQGCKCDVVTLFDVNSDNDLLKKLSVKTCHYSLQKKIGFDIKCSKRLYRLIKAKKYDIVHAHIGAIPYILLSSILLKKSVRFVATIHSEARREAGSSIMKWSRFLLFKSGLCVPVTISEESKLSFENFYKMEPSMVYNGVSNYMPHGGLQLRDNQGQLLFIHPASCQPVKNQQLLIKAFARLTKEYPNSKMIWVGRNDTYKSLFDSLVQEMVPQFKYVGPVSNVRDYLSQSDAMCLSSQMEGMPMTIIEAFSVGCPALCTPVGGIVNMIEDGVNGMLSNGLAVDDYYLMLKRFCAMCPEERNQMKKMASKSFENYSIERTTLEYLNIYKGKINN